MTRLRPLHLLRPLVALALAGCMSSAPAAVDLASTPSTAAPTVSSTAPSTVPPDTEASLPDAFAEPPRPEDPAARAAFAAAKATWLAAGLRDYAFRVRFSCFCPMYGPWDVVVRDGAVVSSTPLDAAEQVVLLELSLLSIDELVVEYDPTLGYPVRAVIRSVGRSEVDETSWEIASLVPA